MMPRPFLAVTLALLAVPAAAQSQPQSQPQGPPPSLPRPQMVQLPCERACMEDLARRFLAALAAHDASTLPIAPNARYTENGQAMGFDNGLWRTASKVGAYRHVFADPAGGHIDLFSAMDENGRALTLAVRIRLELAGSLNRASTLSSIDFAHITAVELVTYRTGSGPAWNDAG